MTKFSKAIGIAIFLVQKADFVFLVAKCAPERRVSAAFGPAVLPIDGCGLHIRPSAVALLPFCYREIWPAATKMKRNFKKIGEGNRRFCAPPALEANLERKNAQKNTLLIA